MSEAPHLRGPVDLLGLAGNVLGLAIHLWPAELLSVCIAVTIATGYCHYYYS